MPVLVTFNSKDGEKTIRADGVETSPLGGEHIKVVGINDLEDAQHPDLKIHTIHVRIQDVRSMADAVTVQTPITVGDS